MSTTAKRRTGGSATSADDTAMRVLRRFRVVFNHVKTHFRHVKQEAGVSGAQAWALAVVQQTPGIGIGGLAQAMDVHQSTASNLVRALVERRLLVSEHGAEDRRQVQLYVTPNGQKALMKAPEPFEGVLPDALRRMDPQTLARLDRDLARVAREIGAASSGGVIPMGDDDD